jgi:Putative Ig domain
MATDWFLTGRMRPLVLSTLLFVLAGCSGDDPAHVPNSSIGPSATATNTAFGRPLTSAVLSSETSANNAAPTLSGTPPTTATVGQLYSFRPAGTDPAGRILTFSIQDKPKWAGFNTSTGQLSGTPTSADSGTDSNIVISVNDGAATATLAPFAIQVAQGATNRVTLAWVAPTENTDGSPLVNLAGYRIYYGTDPSDLTNSIDINNVGIQTYDLGNLTRGTWYFAVTAVNSNDAESKISNIDSVTI